MTRLSSHDYLAPMPLSFRGFPVVRRAHVVAFIAAAFGVAGAAGALAALPEEGRPILRNHPSGEHMHHPVSQAVTQDTAGVIVFGSGLELLLYDGAVWKSVTLPDDSAGARQFARTADGTIYLGGPGVIGFLRGRGHATEFVSLADRLPATARPVGEIRYVAAIGDAVYFSDEENILTWQGGHFTALRYSTPTYAQGVRLHAVGGELYVTALQQPLSRLAGGRLATVADDPVLRENQIVSVEAGPTPGALVLLTAERGFFQLANGRVSELSVDANRWLAGKRVYRALRLPDGSLVVAFSSVSGDGGARFDADGRYRGPLNNTVGLMVKTLRDFFLDREGGLWIGTESGSIRLEWPSAVSLFDVDNGLGQGGVADLVRHEGTLYAASTEGLFQLQPADFTEPPGRPARFERLSSAAACGLVSHPKGLLVLGYDALCKWTPAGLDPVAPVPPGGGVLLRSIRDADLVWVGTATGVFSVRHTVQGWVKNAAIAELAGACRSLVEASDGALWVTTQAGAVIRVREGHPPETLGAGDGLPEGPGKASFATDPGEVILLPDASSPPLRFEPGPARFRPLAGTSDLTVDREKEHQGWVASGTDDAFWLASGPAVWRLPRRGGAAQRLPHFALAAAGRVSRLYAEQGKGGEVLWIGGTRGLVRVEVARALVATGPYATGFVKANVTDGEKLAPEHRPLTFEYVAPRFRFDSTLTYQTRLVGKEKAWSAWEATRSRSFPHLPSGSYRFEVRARDADGEVSAPASLAFVILTPWWCAWWAVAGYAAAGVGVVFGVVRWRTRALRQRARQLEQEVDDRTQQLQLRSAELAAQNVELLRLNRLELDEKVSARLAEEKARLEVLRYQLNPHFLFNTLASISGSLPPERSVARTMVDRLAEFCRLTLHRGDERDWTTVGEEVRLLRAYLEIERSRWGDLLDIEIICDAALDGERLPHFLLLPLAENALKYGRATSRDRVAIRLVASRGGEGELLLEVSNTGEWVEPGTKRNVASLGIGLDNLRERLARYFPKSHRLTLSHTDGWVTVVLCIFPPPNS